MNDLKLYAKQSKFEFPDDRTIDQMDLIDIRRKIMKWCAKSQGAIGPCRVCDPKCQAGIRAIELYDGIQAAEAVEPSVEKTVTKNEEKKEPEKIKKEVVAMKKEKKRRPVSQWYDEAMASGAPEEWCVKNLGITIQQAKKRIYMYEYNRFGIRRTKNAEASATRPVEGPVVKVDQGPVAKAEKKDFSLIDAMMSEMQMLTRKQEEYKAQIDDLTEKHRKISDRIEAITMCIELYKDKASL